MKRSIVSIKSILVIVLIVSLTLGIDASSSSEGVILNSPLKTLTMFDESVVGDDRSSIKSARATFLERFKSGIASQQNANKKMMDEEVRKRKEEEDGVVLSVTENEAEEESLSSSAGQWAEYTLSKEEAAMYDKRRKMEEAFDKGFHSAVKSTTTTKKETLVKKYQMVGVVLGEEEGVKWYARKKPKNAIWNIRLVHVDKAAVLRDMYVNGQIDIFAKYENKGNTNDGTVHIQPIYTIRQRNWRTLWNINPIHYFTQRSGMYWREKRLPNQGLYTDGKSIFQSTYRYTEGKNGMKPISNINFRDFLKTKWKNVPQSRKDSLLYKLDHESPDVVLEY